MITLRVNGKVHEVEASPLCRLVDVLRGPLGMPGTKEGCGEGECGSCTVLLDGEPVNSCLVLAGQAEGREVTTVEGLGDVSHLSALQQCFVEDGGAQCGICTPGMIVSAEALLRTVSRPTDDQIRTATAGNLCRCTGYQRIVDAIRRAAEARAGNTSSRASVPPPPRTPSDRPCPHSHDSPTSPTSTPSPTGRSRT